MEGGTGNGEEKCRELGAGKGLAACVASVVALNKELKKSTGIKSMHGDFFFPSGDLILLWNLFQLS